MIDERRSLVMVSGRVGKGSSQEKRETLERFLSDEHALVHIAPQAEGVELPEHLTKNPTVTLKLSRYFRGRLEISESLVTAELLFGESYFPCKVPLSAIWGVTSIRGQFLMWPESAPSEVLASLEQQAIERRSSQERAATADTDASRIEAAREMDSPDLAPSESEKVGSASQISKERPKLRRIK
jgi:stringent starvation protein B